jgi:LemA protein
MVAVLIALGVLVVLVLYVIGVYNSLVRLRNEFQAAWSQIDVQLKRRYDLIPNLVETVKGYAAHERGTLEAVVQARQQAIDAHGVAQQAQAENVLTGALRQLFALAENYPTLKANENFLALQEELTSTENKIAFARQHYNEVVRRYNTRIESFPANLVAGPYHFVRQDLFELAAPAEREAPKVKF